MATADHRDADPDVAWDLLITAAPMRQGRSIGRTLYLQVSSEPSDDDICVGIVDSPRLAAFIARAVNTARDIRPW